MSLFSRAFLPILLLCGTAPAATLHVSPRASDGGAFSTIQAAVNAAKAGDTVLIHAGTYREKVEVRGDSLEISPAPGEDVILSGADLIPPTEWVRNSEKPIWQHTPWTYRGRTHPKDEFHRLIGRTEQVIVDGKLLQPVLEPGQMRPGTFCADTEARTLFVWMSDGGDPAKRRIEASVRPVLMSILGHHDKLSRLRFLYASNRAQEAALRIEGSDNVVEDSIAEWTNGVGVSLSGERNVLRRVISRSNGQLGISGHGAHNRMENCTLDGNNVKGFAKRWEAGGIKVANSRDFQIIRSTAVRNDGPGFWFDIDNRDERVEGSYTAENNGPGIFVEISETAAIRNNLCVRNGLKDEPGAWGHAGILLGEAMQSIVEHNVCAGNRVGIEVRQQGIRALPADPSRGRPAEKRYFSDQLTFRHNISAYNREWQFALVGDNAFFGAPREVTAADMRLFDPDQRGWHSQANLYYAASGEGLILWGAKWLPKHRQFTDPADFAKDHPWDQDSIAADPLFVDWEAGNFTLRPASPAARIGAGFTAQPVTGPPAR